jgi:hypothetical protein
MEPSVQGSGDAIKRLSLDQEDIAGVNDADLAVLEPQPQRAILLETLEPAGPVGGHQRRADRVGDLEPAPANRPHPLLAPQGDPAGEGVGKPLEEQIGRGSGAGEIAQAGHRALDEIGPGGEVDAEAGDHRLPFPLEQDAGDLGPVGEQVVGPFERETGCELRCRFMKGDRRRQRESVRGRITRSRADKRARVEIAFRRFPGPALTPLAPDLAAGAKPFALGSAGARERGDIVVCGARLGDEPDQKIAAAAASVARSR